MFRLFEGTTADQVWRDIAGHFNRDCESVQASRAGLTHEILHAAICICDPIQRWVLSRNPPINLAFAIAEVIWLVNGHNDSRFLSFWNTRLPRFAGEGPTFHGAYGYRLRSHLGLDQLDRAFHALRNNPDGRQVVLQIWDSVVDFPDRNGAAVAPDVPCNIVSLLKVRDNRLEWTQVMRSNDAFLGLPYNFVQFTYLQEILAGWLGLRIGSYNHVSDSLHVYSNDIDKLRSLDLVEAAANGDRLSLGWAESKEVFERLNVSAREMTSESLTEDRLRTMITSSIGPEAYQNMLLLLAAEAARRRSWESVRDEAADLCTNSAMTQMWERWLIRMAHRTRAASA